MARRAGPSGDRRSQVSCLAHGGSLGQTIHSREPFVATDIATDPRQSIEQRRRIGERGTRSGVWVPMLREGTAIGALSVTRSEVGAFADDKIALLQTFADQAVIAVENVRLFKELEARNAELTEALEQQTATAEILRVISRSQTDIQPVFDAIVRSAVQLCAGVHGVVLRYDGDLMHLVADHGVPVESLGELRQRFPLPPGRDLIGGRAITERRVVHIPDLASDPTAPSDSATIARIGGHRSLLAVPMMRGQDPIGCIVVSRGQAAFSDKQIELLKTFADQAVIAIENARLFSELQARTAELTRSVGQLTALGDVGRAVSSTLDLETVLTTIVSRAAQLAGADGGSIYEYDEATEEFALRATHNLDDQYLELRRRSGSGRARAPPGAWRSPTSPPRFLTSPSRAPTTAGSATSSCGRAREPCWPCRCSARITSSAASS